MIKTLNTSDGTNSTSAVNNKAITEYSLDATEDWNTQIVDITPSGIDFYILEDEAITGTGTLKLQESPDGVTFMDSVDSEGNNIELSIDGSNTLDVIKDYETAGRSYRRLNWDSGTVSAGRLTIYVNNE